MTNQTTTAGSTISALPKMQEQMMGAAGGGQMMGSGKRTLRQDIHVKWNKFTEQEVGNFKSNDDLVTHLVARYGLTRDTAQHDADTLRAGRDI
jgi:hypothetical protein